MQVRKLKDSLNQIEVMLQEAGGTSVAGQLSSFCTVLDAHEDKTVASFVNLVKKNWKADGRAETYPESLKELFANMEALYRVTGPVSLANDYQKLLELFAGVPSGQPEAFVEEIGQAAVAKKASTRKTSPVIKRGEKNLEDFADALRNSTRDSKAFDTLVKELGSSAEYSDADIYYVTSAYLGYESSFDTRQSALNAIQNRWLLDAMGMSQFRGFGRSS